MKIAVGSDEKNNLTDSVLKDLKKRGHKTVLCGALFSTPPDPKQAKTVRKIEKIEK